MSVILRAKRLLLRTALILLVSLLTFSVGSPFILSPTVSANSWNGWDDIDTIAILTPPDGFLNTAAQELQTYLGKMSGWSWNVVQNDVTGPAIRLQVKPAAPEFANRGDEAVRLVSDSGGVRIIGKTSIAVRHGAYILLEKLGVRWFFKSPAWEVVPPSLVDLGALDEVQEPSYFYRVIGPPHSVGEDKSATWYMRNRLIGTTYYPIYHSYSRIIDRSEYAAHPDWFLPEDTVPDTVWQLNPDNPEVIDRAIQYARDELSKPAVKFLFSNDLLTRGAVCISPRDGGGWYPPYDETDWQLITDKVFYLANKVAKAIKTEFPGKYVSVYNYFIYAGIPTYALEPNLMAFVTTSFNLTPLTITQRIEGLRAKGIQVGIRDYLVIWQWEQDSPVIDFDRIRRVAWYATKGAHAYTGEASDGWGSQGLTYYLVSKLLWNNNADVDALLDDFYDKAFGPAKHVMRHYFETRNTDDASLAASFRDLDQAESLAVGNEEILERIRQLEYYNRYVWLWHNKGITELNLQELKSFYTFINRVRDLYLVYYRDVQKGLRAELRNRGLTDSEIDALQNFTPPTAEEARRWLDEGLTEFNGFFTPYINPRQIELRALGDTVEPKLPVMHGWYQDILVPSGGNENIDIMVKGPTQGVVQWYDPSGVQLDYKTFENEIPDWTHVTFRADIPGTYILHSTRIRPFGSNLYIDVPNRPASIIATPARNIYSPDEYVPYNAPSYWGPTAEYFYVPQGTKDFRFGANTCFAKWPAHGKITDPNGITYPFKFDKQDWYSEEIAFDSPAPGIWKIDIDMDARSANFWLVGIPPLVWHDPEYLLVAAADSAPSPPTLNNIGDKAAYIGLPFQLTISAVDPNYDPLTFSAYNMPPWASFDPATRTLSGTTNQMGIYSNVRFEVSDGTFTDSETITIEVTKNQAPILSTIDNKLLTEGQKIEFKLSATDPYGDRLSYSASNLPPGATFDAVTYTFSWTPTSGQAGIYSGILFEVSDGFLTDSENITITVNTPTPSGSGGGGGGSGGGGGGVAGVALVRDSVTAQGRFTVDVTTKSEDRKVELYIPKDTIGKNRVGSFLTRISIKEAKDPPDPPEECNVVGPVYDLSPDGTTFEPPISLTIEYSESKIPDGVNEENLIVAYWDEETREWIELECTVDPDDNTITAKVSHFTDFALLGKRSTTPTEKPLPPLLPNSPPVANHQSVAIDEDSFIVITLDGSDPDGDHLTYTVTSDPGHGPLLGTPPVLIYTPSRGFSGTDTFTFTVSDGEDASKPATVTIIVKSVSRETSALPRLNSAPLANFQNITTDTDSPIVVALDASDPDGDYLTYSITSNPIYGSLSGTPPLVTYTPNPDFSGSDSFTFTASDGTTTSNAATVTITVNEKNLDRVIFLANKWSLGGFPVIFYVPPILLVLVLAVLAYNYASPNSRYKRIMLRRLRYSQSVLNPRKR